MQSHVLSFSHRVSVGSCVCDALGLCLCVVVSASGLPEESPTLYRFECKHTILLWC